MLGIETAFLFGMVHALEPGHGKTAMTALMLDKRNGIRESLSLAISAAFSHSLVIFGLACLTHIGGHLFLESNHEFSPFFSRAAGAVLILIGVYLFFKKTAAGAKSACCSSGRKSNHLKVSAALGFSIGLFPCPSLLAVFVASFASGKTDVALASVGMFALGMMLCILAVGFICRWIGQKSHGMLDRFELPWFKIQGLFISVVGAYYILA